MKFLTKSVVLQLLSVAVICLVLLALLEGAARMYYAYVKEGDLVPLPYVGAEFYNNQFIQEQKEANNYNTPEGTRLLIADDYSGAYINIVNNRRKTIRRYSDYEHSLYFFGGSTVFSNTSPDNLTSSSILQKFIDDQFPGSYKVENCGVTSYNVLQQLGYLKTFNLSPKDIVVFFDGGNDIYQGIFFKNPDGWIADSIEQEEDKMPFLTRLAYFVYYRFKDYSDFIRLISNPHKMKRVKHLDDLEEVKRLATQLTDNYTENIIEAYSYASSSKAYFLHFTSPNIFTKSKKTEYEKTLIQGFMPGLDLVYAHGNKALSESHKRLISAGIEQYDLAKAFDHVDHVYLDWCHFNHIGEAIVAESIFERVKPIIQTVIRE